MVRIDYTFHLLYKRVAAKFKDATIERHWDKLVAISDKRRNANPAPANDRRTS